jgi:uncharacterized protein YggT (Ycf19 family)
MRQAEIQITDCPFTLQVKLRHLYSIFSGCVEKIINLLRDIISIFFSIDGSPVVSPISV